MLIVLQRSVALRLALQQAENVLLGCVGLGQHRGRGLLQDLVFGQVCGFQSKVCILDATLAADRLDEMLVRLLTVWFNRLEIAPNLDRWMLTSLMAVSIKSMPVRALTSPEPSSATVSFTLTTESVPSPTPSPVAFIELMLTAIWFCAPVAEPT